MKTMRHKLAVEPRTRAAPGFPQVGRRHYLDYLQQLHRDTNPRVYLEIGTESGASLILAECLSIAVDPQFKLEADVIGNKPEAHFFQGNSDDFFASRLIERLGVSVDLAFLDGMHLFEYLLRDFINAEALASAEGCIYLHDCVPSDYPMAERVWDKARTGAWTGDVWKLVPILREYRPDLDVKVLDLAPTGLVRVGNLNPQDRRLREAYDEIVARYADVTIDSFGLDQLREALSFDAAEEVAPAAPVRLVRSRRISLLIPPNSFPKAPLWGEYWFGIGLARAFQRLGIECEILPRKRWQEDHGQSADVVLPPHADYQPQASRKSVLWVIYGDDRLTPAEEESAAHVFSASAKVTATIGRRLGADRVSTLFQAFDRDVMSPDGSTRACGRLYVANQHDEVRRTARLLLETGMSADIYGRKWEKSALAHMHLGQKIENAELPAYYRGARLVFNDHAVGMADAGFISNRVFDVLACGAPLVTDHVDGMPSDIARQAFVYGSDAEFSQTVARAEAEADTGRAERRDFALAMRERHSFDQRAARILEALG